MAGNLRSSLKSIGASLLVAIIASTTVTVPAQAQRGLSLVRDAEIEALIRDYSLPIFKAAGLKKSYVNIHIVNSNDFNAFVANGRRMFMNTGTLKQTKTPNEVIGVIAHEVGHITGGHLAGIRTAAANARTISIFAQILAGAAAIAGAVGGSQIAAQGGVVGVQAAGGIGVRSFLAHQRAQEVSADRAAIKYLEKTGQSGEGMLKTFSALQRQIPIGTRFIDPFTLSHPLPRERIALIQRLVEKSKFRQNKDSPELLARHKLMQAKIAAYTEHPQQIGRKFPKKDKSLAADYARAIVGYRFGNVKKAQKTIDALIKRAPNYPYFWELKGQAYLDSGQPKNAIAPLRKALKLSPGQPLMLARLGHALVATENPSFTNEAIEVLSQAVARDQSLGLAHRQLAIAYNRQGKIAEATLAHANGLFYLGDVRGAKVQASRAKKKFPRGSRGWLEADDIISFRKPKLR